MRTVDKIRCIFTMCLCLFCTLGASADEDAILKKQNLMNTLLSRNDILIEKLSGVTNIPLEPEYMFSSNVDYHKKTKFETMGNSGSWGYPYLQVMRSKDQNAIFMYPLFDYDISRFEGQIQEDVAYAAEDELMDIRPFVKIIDKNDGTYISNADKAVIYEFKTPKKHFGLYDNFVGIYLRKYGHGCLLLKIGLTEEGLKHKDEYIKMLLSSIKYGDKILNPDDKMPTDDEFRFEPPTRLRPVARPGYIQ